MGIKKPPVPTAGTKGSFRGTTRIRRTCAALSAPLTADPPGIGRSSRANEVRFSQDALSRRRPSLARNLGTIFPIQAINSITKLFIPHFAQQINVKGEENLTWGFENAIIFADKSLRFRSGGKPCTASNRARRICRGARPTPINMITAACSSSAAASATPARRRCAPMPRCAAVRGWCPSACRRRSMRSPP